MDFKYAFYILFLLTLNTAQSCSHVLATCCLHTFLNEDVIIDARDLINKEWEVAYYFSDIDCFSEIQETLNISYDKSDYEDLGRRFVFLCNNRIIHQEIYWDSCFYRCRIPEFICDTCTSVRIIHPQDKIRIYKQEDIFLLSIVSE